jgi:hypothetical protein
METFALGAQPERKREKMNKTVKSPDTEMNLPFLITSLECRAVRKKPDLSQTLDTYYQYFDSLVYNLMNAQGMTELKFNSCIFFLFLFSIKMTSRRRGRGDAGGTIPQDSGIGRTLRVPEGRGPGTAGVTFYVLRGADDAADKDAV